MIQAIPRPSSNLSREIARKSEASYGLSLVKPQFNFQRRLGEEKPQMARLPEYDKAHEFDCHSPVEIMYALL